jgi:hypothetical protein
VAPDAWCFEKLQDTDREMVRQMGSELGKYRRSAFRARPEIPTNDGRFIATAEREFGFFVV